MNNPYSSPPSLSVADDSETPSVPFSIVARRIFVAWEKLRLAYVAVLALVTIGVARGALLDPHILVPVVLGAVVANVCFFAGPITETYLTWLGFNPSWLRAFMFILGTTLAAVLALVTIMGSPTMN